MKIKTCHDTSGFAAKDSLWVAYDDETYDGPDCLMGSGATPQEAGADLLEKMDWFPIEDAPRDGTMIQLVGYVVPSAEAERNGSRPLWCLGIGSYLWNDQWSGILGSRPSHWRARSNT